MRYLDFFQLNIYGAIKDWVWEDKESVGRLTEWRVRWSSEEKMHQGLVLSNESSIESKAYDILEDTS